MFFSGNNVFWYEYEWLTNTCVYNPEQIGDRHNKIWVSPVNLPSIAEALPF